MASGAMASWYLTCPIDMPKMYVFRTRHQLFGDLICYYSTGTTRPPLRRSPQPQGHYRELCALGRRHEARYSPSQRIAQTGWVFYLGFHLDIWDGVFRFQAFLDVIHSFLLRGIYTTFFWVSHGFAFYNVGFGEFCPGGISIIPCIVIIIIPFIIITLSAFCPAPHYIL